MESTVEKNHVRAVARAGPEFRAVAGAALAALAFAVLAGCGKTTKPKDVKHNIYIGATHVGGGGIDTSYNRIYILDAESLTVIDSMFQTHYTDDLTASPDGQWLYIAFRMAMSWNIPDTLKRMNIRTRTEDWPIPTNSRGRFPLLGNGTLLLHWNDVYRTSDASLVRTIGDQLFLCPGAPTGTEAAVVTSQRPRRPMSSADTIVQLIDVVTGNLRGRYVSHLSDGRVLAINYARLHPDGRRVLTISGGRWFLVGDIETGQTLFQSAIDHALGEIAISDDGNLAAVTDPGTTAFDELGSLYIADLRQYTLLKRFTPGPGSQFTGASQVRFLPGSHKLITAPASDFWDTGPLNLIDLNTMQVEKVVWLPIFEPFIGGLDVGPRP